MGKPRTHALGKHYAVLQRDQADSAGCSPVVTVSSRTMARSCGPLARRAFLGCHGRHPCAQALRHVVTFSPGGLLRLLARAQEHFHDVTIVIDRRATLDRDRMCRPAASKAGRAHSSTQERVSPASRPAGCRLRIPIPRPGTGNREIRVFGRQHRSGEFVVHPGHRVRYPDPSHGNPRAALSGISCLSRNNGARGLASSMRSVWLPNRQPYLPYVNRYNASGRIGLPPAATALWTDRMPAASAHRDRCAANSDNSPAWQRQW